MVEYSNNIVDYIDSVFKSSESVLNYFYKMFFKEFQPDINGYNLLFMVPPDLSGFRISNPNIYSDDPSSFMSRSSKLLTFSAIDFSPPVNQLNTERISSRSGAIPYATELTSTEQCSVIYLDNSNLDVYHFHHIWLEYIRSVLDGLISPDPKYLDPENVEYGAIDYTTSLYIVKYLPNMKKINYIGKCIGIFPQSMPGKELLGQRIANDITTLPFSYFCAAFREATWREEKNHWIFDEFKTKVESRFFT